MAVEGSAVDAAGPAAGVTGLWGAGTGVVGPRPAAAPAALIHPRAGRDADLPGPARPAAHEPSPPWPGRQAPTNPPSRRARPSRSRMAPPPYSRPGGLQGPGLVRPAPEGPTVGAPCTVALPIACGGLRSKGRPGEADQTGRRWSARGRSRCRVALNGPVRRLGATRP